MNQITDIRKNFDFEQYNQNSYVNEPIILKNYYYENIVFDIYITIMGNEFKLKFKIKNNYFMEFLYYKEENTTFIDTIKKVNGINGKMILKIIEELNMIFNVKSSSLSDCSCLGKYSLKLISIFKYEMTWYHKNLGYIPEDKTIYKLFQESKKMTIKKYVNFLVKKNIITNEDYNKIIMIVKLINMDMNDTLQTVFNTLFENKDKYNDLKNNFYSILFSTKLLTFNCDTMKNKKTTTYYFMSFYSKIYKSIVSTKYF
jgi:hypothetical protein